MRIFFLRFITLVQTILISIGLKNVFILIETKIIILLRDILY